MAVLRGVRISHLQQRGLSKSILFDATHLFHTRKRITTVRPVWCRENATVE